MRGSHTFTKTFLTELQVQYELDQLTEYTALNGYKFDSKITFNESSGALFKAKGGAINVSARAHYEHVIMNYPWGGGTAENVYSWKGGGRLPVNGDVVRGQHQARMLREPDLTKLNRY